MRPPLRLSPRPDEPLYSVLARLTHCLGEPGRGELQRALLGADLPIYDDLPVGLGTLTDNGWLSMGVDEALHRLTLFPYYAAFSASDTREAAKSAMAGPGPWPHQVIRSWHTDVSPVDRLRFCAACRIEMLTTAPDAWWRRVHQLPSVLVCPDHGEPLLLSTLSRRERRKGYFCASDVVCPPEAEPLIETPEERHSEGLLWLARLSQTLLRDCAKTAARVIVDDYRLTANKLGLDGRIERDAKAISTIVMDRWGSVLDEWPALADPRLGKVIAVAFRSGSVPPLVHLLLAGALPHPEGDESELYIVSQRKPDVWNRR